MCEATERSRMMRPGSLSPSGAKTFRHELSRSQWFGHERHKNSRKFRISSTNFLVNICGPLFPFSGVPLCEQSRAEGDIHRGADPHGLSSSQNKNTNEGAPNDDPMFPFPNLTIPLSKDKRPFTIESSRSLATRARNLVTSL